MSRIRTIKPEFWASEQVVSCSTNARLLFIGLWNFSDDNGIHPASHVRLKAEVFPVDNFSMDDIKRWVDELLAKELLSEYSVSQKIYWIVTGWKSHQRIDKANPRYPLPCSNSVINMGQLVNIPRVIDDQSANNIELVVKSSIPEGKGMEENGKEDIIVSRTDSPSQCQQKEIIKLYHKILPMCRPVRSWNKTRQRHLRQRWCEDPVRQCLEWWQEYFEYVKKSKFLTGGVDRNNEGRPPFVADLEFLIKPVSFTNVIEGKYHEGCQL